MVFNWFRRQFSDRPSADDTQQAEPSPTPSTPDEPETKQPLSPTTGNEDYLQWAKAAYQNIQQQQKPTETTTESPTESPTEAAVDDVSPPTEAEKSTSEAQETPAELTETTEPVAVVEEVAEEVAQEVAQEVAEEVAQEVAQEAEEVTETPEPVAEEVAQEVAQEVAEEVSEEAAEVTETAEPVAMVEETIDQLPIWARTQAERQERIERLKETAISEPEPEGGESIATGVESTDIVFDEMFLWSAEVLANQGRRPEEVAVEEITWLQKLWKGLGRTRRNLLNQLKAIVGQGPLNQAAVEEIEALLLQADVGVEATDVIIEALQNRLREDALPPEDAIAYLKQLLRDLLEKPYQNGYSPTFAPEKEQLNIWLITGVNGAGKTTTIGKIAHIAQKSDYRSLIAAGDTFRAAAVEQVKVWGERSGVEVIANPGKNTDPAAVVYDAIAAAKSRQTELLIIDTAGRLQNKKNLMEELNKIRRVIDKQAPDAKVESLLVLDSTLGQNGLRQAQVFAEVAQLSGVVLTKLDGTAKGGVALAVVQQLGLPIRFIGVGESIEDLRPFSSYEFIEALLSG
ncbi:MAG: signal recognition particle-docking protein FtsY [Arthrospira sp. SH-MAG29]|nr:signal recognition particle-docking protein FtsY [Arthrospira sp. SH-MAG29]MBS0014961.1 signal recognition particle-docking protein FtsY [Arthrospira sp. SH-MAG29]